MSLMIRSAIIVLACTAVSLCITIAAIAIAVDCEIFDTDSLL